MSSDLGAHLSGDEALRCLVVTGEGRSFSAGLDLVEGLAGAMTEWADRPLDDETIAFGLEAAGTYNWLPRLHCPSVAAVRGHAYGGGLQLALACDFRVFGESARVGLTEMRFGLLPDMGATYRLPRIVGESRAREMILLGEVIDAVESLRIGLADRLVPDTELLATASLLANRLAAQPPLAIAGARRAIEASWHQDPDTSFRVAVSEQARCLTSLDFKEAARALAEGRDPQWQGR